MPRYGEEPSYSRPRGEIPRDNRDVRRIVEPTTSRERDHYHIDNSMDMPRMDRMDSSRIDPSRMDVRTEPLRANTGRPVRGPQEVIYRDQETGHIYTGGLPPPPPIRRDSGPPPGPQRSQQYNEYFVPGDGIDREVIQREICRYLGPDAICRPGKNESGRSGFIVRAYRALTSEMIRSLRESSEKFASERERRRWTGRSADVSYNEVQDNRDYYYHDSMDVEIPDDRSPQSRGTRDLDPSAHPRVSNPGRYQAAPGGGYVQEHPGHSISSAVPGQYSMHNEPRSLAPGTTPPPVSSSMRSAVPGYAQPPVFPGRTTSVTSSGMAAPIYRESTADRVTNYPYPTDSRHRR